MEADQKFKAVLEDALAGIDYENCLLFGSRARGTARDDSDYDVLVILKQPCSQLEKYAIANRIRSHLAQHLIPADVLVKTKEDIKLYGWRQGVPSGMRCVMGSRYDGKAEKTLQQAVANWLLKAENDLIMAKDERFLKKDGFVTDGICFHCQQAAEKYLKAFLVLHSVDFEKTHNLEFLANLCKAISGDFGSLEFGNLTNYGISVNISRRFLYSYAQGSRRSIGDRRTCKIFCFK